VERAFYGDTVSYRHRCPRCGLHTLSGGTEFKCDCGYKSYNVVVKREIIETGKPRRRVCPADIKKRLIEDQDDKCFWCEREIGQPYYKSSKVRYLKRNYDHAVPYARSGRNTRDNWRLSCDVCNRWKASLVFDNEYDCSEYLKRKWSKAIARGSIVEEE